MTESDHLRDSMRLFDLNIEKVLDHWEPHHAIREVIANALDECTLTGTSPIQIAKDSLGNWHIRDYGRGIHIDDFTLNENPEKLNSDCVIGKFGVGLKDALATFDRHGIGVAITSPHGSFHLTKATKRDYDGITTLHISHDSANTGIEGTDVILSGVSDEAVAHAKSLFLIFRPHQVLEDTQFGQIISKTNDTAHIFINGVWANNEPSFLFSYNITSLTESMRKALNRERVNVGRSVYADRIRQILKSSQHQVVTDELANAYFKKEAGDLPEELTWIDISNRALNELAKQRQVVCLSESEIKARPEVVDDIKNDGFHIVLINDKEKQRADEQANRGDAPFHTLHTWVKSVNDSFQYSFVDIDSLNDSERSVFNEKEKIFSLVDQHSSRAPQVRVSETMRASEDVTNGVWDPAIPAIVIKRSQLRSLQTFAGTLLHELVHATTGASDCTRMFETVLTRYVGMVTDIALRNRVEKLPDSRSEEHLPHESEPVVSQTNGIKFVRVMSSNVDSIGYDENSRTLYVAFKNGSRYFYTDVPKELYTQFLNAPSKGKFLNQHIAGAFKHGNA